MCRLLLLGFLAHQNLIVGMNAFLYYSLSWSFDLIPNFYYSMTQNKQSKSRFGFLLFWLEELTQLVGSPTQPAELEDMIIE